MERETGIILASILLFYVVSIALINKITIHKSFKANTSKTVVGIKENPMILGVNIAILLQVYFSFSGTFNYITSIANEQTSIISFLSAGAIVLIVLTALILFTYVLTFIICSYILKLKHNYTFTIIFVTIAGVLSILLNQLISLLTSTNAYTIF